MKKTIIITLSALVFILALLTTFDMYGAIYRDHAYKVISAIFNASLDIMNSFNFALLLLIIFCSYKQVKKIAKLIGKEIIKNYKPNHKSVEDDDEGEGIDEDTEQNKTGASQKTLSERSYYRIWLGTYNQWFDDCYKNNCIGVDWLSDNNLNEFSKIPSKFEKEVYEQIWNQKEATTPYNAAYAATCLKRIHSEIKKGDIIFACNEKGTWYAARIDGDYKYRKEASPHHIRPVKWLGTVDITLFSIALQNALKQRRTLLRYNNYQEEFETLNKF